MAGLRSMSDSEQNAGRAPMAGTDAVAPRVCVMVLGMHRSGTSALTRVISLLGADLPTNLIGALPSNAKGHWEPEHLNNYHNTMLARGLSRWDDWRAFNLDDLSIASIAEIQNTIRQLIDEAFGQSRLFVLKDPRICRFAPFYLDVLGELGIEPRVVLPLRNPLAVLGSLQERDGMTPGFAALLWLRHVLDAETATRHLPRAVVSYEAVLKDWRAAVSSISARIALQWPRQLEEAAPQIEAFLSTDLQHFAPSRRELVGRKEVSHWVKEAYQALLDFEKDADDDAALASLDRIGTEFNAACPAFGEATFAEIAAREHKAVQVQAQHANAAEALRTAIALREGDIGALRGEVSMRDRQIGELRAGAQALQAETQALLTGREGEIASLQGELARRRWFGRGARLVMRGDAFRVLRKAMRDRRHARLLARSDLFDAAYYLQQYSDVRLAAVDPVRHYLNDGAREGRNPSADFETVWYLLQNPDVAAANVNPLVHYLYHGAREGRVGSRHDVPKERMPLVEPPAPVRPPRKRLIQARHFRQVLAELRAASGARGKYIAGLSLAQRYLTARLVPLRGPEILSNAVQRANLIAYVNDLALNPHVSSTVKPTINFVLPALDPAIIFGGYLSAFQFTSFLLRRGFHVRLVVTDRLTGSAAEMAAACDAVSPAVGDVLRKVALLDRTTGRRDAPFDVSRDDIFMAYSCSTAVCAHNTVRKYATDPIIFYIQEEEGHFHAHNALRALCESVYDLPYFGIYNSPQLAHYFEIMKLGSFGNNAACKEHMTYRHALSTSRVPTKTELAGRKARKLLFFARPEPHAERNLFELGLLALQTAAGNNVFPPETWELHAIGTERFAPLPLPGGQVLKFIGKLPLSDYAKVLADYDVGLSLMFAPHPSVPNLELSAAGVPTVTTTFVNRDAAIMRAISGNLIPVQPSVQSLVSGLVEAVARSARFAERLDNARFDWPRSWSQTFDAQFETELMSKLGRTYGPSRIARLMDDQPQAPTQ